MKTDRKAKVYSLNNASIIVTDRLFVQRTIQIFYDSNILQ